jgi:methylase of polypeptide subunit release factors
MSYRTFANRELEASDRIARHISRGGVAVLQGRWERITQLYRTLEAKGAGPADLQRLMLQVEGDWIPTVEPAQHLPYLSFIYGDLVALPDLQAGLAAMTTLHPVPALGATLVVHPGVLVPKSQPLIHLLRRAMEALQPALPAAPAVLDMGCGSGVCALLAAQVFPCARVLATDHLAEAVASTRINADRLALPVETAGPGDLYDPVGERRFDLIIFNAPWVAAPARNRAETALNDGGQQTIRRFLEGAPARLNPGGHVLVGYADQSGPKAIANLERFAAEAGLRLQGRLSDRIKTHRSKRAWESIFAYDFTR